MNPSRVFLVALGILIAVCLATIPAWLARQIQTKALDKVRTLIEQKTGDIVVQGEQLAGNLRQAETRNTERDEVLRNELTRLRRENASLRTRLDEIGGAVSAISTSITGIDLSGGDTVHVGTGDFTHQFTDPWITANISRRDSSLRFDYKTTFRIEEFDVEVLLANGAKTHLFNTALISTSTGDTLNVPTERHVIERMGREHRRFLWNPQAHLVGAFGLGSAWFGGAYSFASIGRGRYIEASDFYLLGACILHDGENWTVGASPLAWNAGRVLPFLDNVSVGPVWIWGEKQSGVGVVIGAAL